MIVNNFKNSFLQTKQDSDTYQKHKHTHAVLFQQIICKLLGRSWVGIHH